jgi:hypothetical protein
LKITDHNQKEDAEDEKNYFESEKNNKDLVISS